jgi:large subunit ribosomal protein L24
MVKKTFSTNWKKSTQPRKQRKYLHKAPLHIKQNMIHVHLSADLRKKYELRNIQIRKGDKVRILRGSSTKKEGKIDQVDLKKGKVTIVGLEFIKKDGTKTPMSFVPSNLMIIDLDLSDKKRKNKLQSKGTKEKKESKEASVKGDKK